MWLETSEQRGGEEGREGTEGSHPAGPLDHTDKLSCFMNEMKAIEGSEQRQEVS